MLKINYIKEYYPPSVRTFVILHIVRKMERIEFKNNCPERRWGQIH